ncbi:TIGR03086 family metal-binding protein [Blastococcus sp. Marseille-P5729]|uniref:TIGR03086 family metal-binding protein n=1 Tax=Blastococcus sp. Marseille-P5729 TaxID=2086582 RepID=UPI000D0E7362|nr:TIGR03086 family metal-binding protein [Blastococcus sp. Marseille-P5729]
MKPQQTLDQLIPVLDDLAAVADGVREDQRSAPTPCAEFDVAALTGHITGWLESFAAGFASTDGQCPSSDVSDVRVATDEAGPRIRSAAKTLADAVRGGAATRPLSIGDSGMPGDMALSMILGEYLVHGWDLATATGQRWTPDEGAAESAREFLTTMVTPDSRGEGGWFGPEVDVPQDAGALDRLVGFAGRDPGWSGS